MSRYRATKLNRAYSKRFKTFNKNIFQQKEAGLLLFVEYLQYLRDCLVINSANNLNMQELNKTKIATIVTALAEFNAYKTCQETAKKVFHWNNFCEHIKLNMEEWLAPNDSV